MLAEAPAKQLLARKRRLTSRCSQLRYRTGWQRAFALEEIRATIRQHQEVLAARCGLRVVGVFGSYVRGEQRRGSDLDLLADLTDRVSLLELVGAELYLSEVLGVKVDLIPKRVVREELRETIFKEAIAI